MGRPSVMGHNFSQVPQANIQRSQFNRSSGYKTTLDAGYIYPIFRDEVLPGDTFNVRANIFARLATPITPFMDNMFMDIHFFFVPMRLLWENWERFNGAQDDPGDSTDFLMPQMTAPAVTGVQVGELSDYFGIPTGIASIEFNSHFHRAYNLIYNQWYRDQNLQNSVVVDRDDGPDTYTDYVLRRRNKRHDYFTSCLPTPQKGPAVSLPLGTEAPVKGIGKINGTWTTAQNDVYESDGTQADYWNSATNALSTIVIERQPNGSPIVDYPYIRADLSAATAATVNDLREAFQVQRLYERDARGGTRYVELLRSHFGVISPDARLQRPEYLGGSSVPVNVHPIAQTSSTDATTPQGNLAAMGTVGNSAAGFVKSFVEHGVVLGLVSIRADLTYQQGLERCFSRQIRWDFYWPSLAHIGEQSVLNKEIYMDGSANDDAVFGYQERFGEYRYKPSLITGKFRSTYAQSLDMWHLSQEFGSLPTLNSTFIQETPPMARVKAVTDEPDFLLDAYFNTITARPMPLFGVPGQIDRF
ncbi:MAG: major capsid protein [Microviridae sp. ctbuH30]|nr:MAG: major capsid protein [Microviridae sp. ctbuH30]